MSLKSQLIAACCNGSFGYEQLPEDGLVWPKHVAIKNVILMTF
jgi:hypothetical protein